MEITMEISGKTVSTSCPQLLWSPCLYVPPATRQRKGAEPPGLQAKTEPAAGTSTEKYKRIVYITANDSTQQQDYSPPLLPLLFLAQRRLVMVDLFVDRVLVKNNKDQDELDTEREIVTRLQNRILMLFFASAESDTCQRFAPTLHDFFKQLTDEFYVERSAQLVLLYVRCATRAFRGTLFPSFLLSFLPSSLPPSLQLRSRECEIAFPEFLHLKNLTLLKSSCVRLRKPHGLQFRFLDQSEEQLEDFLKELPKKSLFLAYEDPYRRCVVTDIFTRELETMFEVREVPTVVVLRPDCSILIPNAVEEITRLGPDCYRNWHEAAELIDRNFLIKEDFEDKSMRSFSDPVRRLKYKVEDEKKKKKKKEKKKRKQRRGWGGGGDEGEEAGAGGADDRDGGGSMW
ncbi:hypothetical protein CCH79_00014269 [Gambusia affinis]|uniref:Thioredoxin-like fold domain-containing protein n=1 Tax=Gambusia affinis TaxID=33528 RepID=A0A315UUQ6_GAMAF|nr:hypothetical protein CCH79_00014269 [Gambusia affinis]